MDAESSRQIVVTLRQSQLQMRPAMCASCALSLVDLVGPIVIRTAFLRRNGAHLERGVGGKLWFDETGNDRACHGCTKQKEEFLTPYLPGKLDNP